MLINNNLEFTFKLKIEFVKIYFWGHHFMKNEGI